MLNMNSPTVQAMLSSLPQGVGNMPIYYGNQPSVTTQTFSPQMPGEYVSQPMNMNPTGTPYPSPKEILMQSAQSGMYSPTSFAPRNIVGGYNPGYQTAFGNYSNPYMGYGTYGGYYPGQQVYMDQDAMERLDNAYFNGLTYDEQLVEESNLYKAMSRIASKNVGRTEEEAEECAKAFDIYSKIPTHDYYVKEPIKPIHIHLKIGDEIVADMKPANVNIRDRNYFRNAAFAEDMKAKQEQKRIENINRQIIMHNNAIERKFDKMDLLDFFNNGAKYIINDMLNTQLRMQSIFGSSQVYNSEEFRKRLLEKNGYKNRSQKKAIDRFVGRYGVMPDGRPVSPGHDPEIATSFSYDPKTGQYSVTAPNFIGNRLETARQSFIRTLEDE